MTTKLFAVSVRLSALVATAGVVLRVVRPQNANW